MRILFLFFLIWIHICLATSGLAQIISDETEEAQDDTLQSRDVFSKLLGEDARFLPVPIPLSDSTIGSGLAVAGLYFHSKREEDPTTPTTVSGVLGLYTSSATWALAAFHDGSYFNDKMRPSALAGYGEANLKFYGIGEIIDLRDNPIDYEAKAFFFEPQALFKLPVKNCFLGLQYFYLNIDTSFDLSFILPDFPAINYRSKTAGLGLVALYDSRDNNIWPTEGTRLEVTGTNYGEHFGGDFRYNKLELKFGQYFPLIDSVTLSYRLDGQFIYGDAPFYDLSEIELRGFPGGRFADNHAVTAQAEVRWNFYKRWTALAFGGVGKIADHIGDLGNSTPQYAGGVGIRYMILKKQKLNIGIDIAYGDGNYSFYIQIGDWLAN